MSLSERDIDKKGREKVMKSGSLSEGDFDKKRHRYGECAMSLSERDIDKKRREIVMKSGSLSEGDSINAAERKIWRSDETGNGSGGVA